jgi:hypothetical protein
MKNASNYGWDLPPEQPKKQDGDYPPNRMWMPAGAKKTVVFVPDDNGIVAPYKLWEYRITDYTKKGRAKWANFEPVPDNQEQDWIRNVLMPVHDGVEQYFVGYITILELDYYDDRKGNRRGPFIRACGMKDKSMRRAKAHHERYNGLAWRKYEWHRTGTDAPAATGDEWFFLEVVDPTTLPKPEYNAALACIDWKSYLQEKSVSELERLYGHLVRGGRTQVQGGTEFDPQKFDGEKQQSGGKTPPSNADINKSAEQVDY